MNVGHSCHEMRPVVSSLDYGGIIVDMDPIVGRVIRTPCVGEITAKDYGVSRFDLDGLSTNRVGGAVPCAGCRIDFGHTCRRVPGMIATSTPRGIRSSRTFANSGVCS